MVQNYSETLPLERQNKFLDCPFVLTREFQKIRLVLKIILWLKHSQTKNVFVGLCTDC